MRTVQLRNGSRSVNELPQEGRKDYLKEVERTTSRSLLCSLVDLYFYKPNLGLFIIFYDVIECQRFVPHSGICVQTIFHQRFILPLFL